MKRRSKEKTKKKISSLAFIYFFFLSLLLSFSFHLPLPPFPYSLNPSHAAAPRLLLGGVPRPRRARELRRAARGGLFVGVRGIGRQQLPRRRRVVPRAVPSRWRGQVSLSSCGEGIRARTKEEKRAEEEGERKRERQRGVFRPIDQSSRRAFFFLVRNLFSLSQPPTTDRSLLHSIQNKQVHLCRRGVHLQLRRRRLVHLPGGLGGEVTKRKRREKEKEF